MSKDQRRYFLQEQLRSIKKELGLEKDDKSALVQKCGPFPKQPHMTATDTAWATMGAQPHSFWASVCTGASQPETCSCWLGRLRDVWKGFSCCQLLGQRVH